MCGSPCTTCDKHIYSHGPGEYHRMCYGCYSIVQNIPEEKLKKVDGKVYPVDAIVHTFKPYTI